MNQMFLPKVSVIIPVYNAEKYIEECLKSILEQSLYEIEVICVDDGSKDQSLAILRRYEEQDSRIKVLTQNNQFAGIARNNGMLNANGEYYAFIDADDYLEKNSLEKLYLIAKKQKLDFIKAKAYLLDEKSHSIYSDPYYTFDAFGKDNFNNVISFEDMPARALSLADVPWNGLYRAEFIKNNDIKFNHFRCVNDRSFFIHCLLSAERFAVTDIFLTYYRVNMSESLVGIRNLHFECQVDSYNIIREIVFRSKSKYSTMVLQRELDNLFYWRKKISHCGIKNEETILTLFFNNFDPNDVGESYLRNTTYYYDYLQYKGKPCDDSELKKKMHCYYAKICKGLRICKEYGIKYVMKRLLG